uniref:Ig-like domain-containing protein n=1 Tax=Erpetoichthys calabaricus TaxID=27687 RepID=A0A8C4XDC1_ERPCA
MDLTIWMFAVSPLLIARISSSSVTSPSTAQSISTNDTTTMMTESTAVTTGTEKHSSESEASTMLSTQSSVMVTTGFSTTTQGSTIAFEADRVTMAELLKDSNTSKAFDGELEIHLVNNTEYIEVGESFIVTCVLRNSFPIADIHIRMYFNGREYDVKLQRTLEEVSATATLVQPPSLNELIACTANMKSLSKYTQRSVVGYKLPKPVIKMPNYAHVGEPVMVKCEVNDSDTADVVLRMLIPKLNINETKAAGVPFEKTFNATKSHNNMEITCVTELGTTAVKKDKRMSLTVFYEPSVSLNNSASIMQISHGGDISIHCIADGSPAPEVTWNYKKEPNVQIVSATILNIKTATSMNNGVYECQANNKHGNATKRFTLEVTSTSYWLILVIVCAILLIILIVPVIYCIYKRKQKRGSYNVRPDGTVIPNGRLEEIPLALEQKQSLQNGELS